MAGRNRDGTLLQDLRSPTTERAVLRQRAQNSCMQAVPGQAKERAASHRERRRNFPVYAPVAHFRKERGASGTNGEVGESPRRQSSRNCSEGRPGEALQDPETQISCPKAPGTVARIGRHGSGSLSQLGLLEDSGTPRPGELGSNRNLFR